MLRAVIFDVDGVLVDSREANLAFYKKLIEVAGYDGVSATVLNACFHLPLKQTLQKVLDLPEGEELDRVRKLAEDPQVRSVGRNIYPTKLKETLEELHRHYKLAIVTGRIRFGLNEIFNEVTIRHLFDVTVTFEDYVNPKPHPEPLLIALKQCGVSPEEAIYIGDSDSDIEAAREAGMRSIHISSSKHIDATTGVKEFNELLAVIHSLE